MDRIYPVEDEKSAGLGASLESEVAEWWNGLSDTQCGGCLGRIKGEGAFDRIAFEWQEHYGAHPSWSRGRHLVPLRWEELSPFWQCCVHYHYDRVERAAARRV